ncbi:MAG: efflux RND transporter periplasmic adaptor subunit [Thermodesulfobacteriota bacterium]
MKGKKGFLHLFLILFLGGNSFSWAQGPPSTPVVVSPVLQKQVRKSVILAGTATPRVRSLFASEVEGLVEELHVEEGDVVKEGQVLAKLGSSTLEIQLEVARAARNEAKERYLQAKAELERSVKLRRSQSIAEKKFLDDRFEAMAWEKRVRQREAQISQLEDLLAKKTIIAPFSGFVAKKHTEVGQWVEQGGGIVTLIDLESVHVVVQVPERYIDKIRVGARAAVSVDALGNRRFPGKIIAIIPEGDREARTFPVKVEINNRDFRTKSGMLCHVTFSLGKPYPALLVPKDAVVNRDNQKFVFVYQNDIVKLVRLDVKGYHGGMAEVSGGVEPGLLVVIRGNERLRDGQKVQVIRETSPKRE